MWPGPYGDWGSRKYLLASLDQSLERMGLDYVDIFYSHRLDPETPLEETMGALDTAVRQGKALYVGISSYSAGADERGGGILRALGTPLLIHQPSYSMLNRWIEHGLLDVLERRRHRLHRLLAARAGPADRPLPGRRAGGLARAPRAARFAEALLTEENLARVRALNEIAAAPRPVARADGDRLGAARPARHLGADRRAAASSSSRRTSRALENLDFTADELAEIDRYATEGGINLWPPSPIKRTEVLGAERRSAARNAGSLCAREAILGLPGVSGVAVGGPEELRDLVRVEVGPGLDDTGDRDGRGMNGRVEDLAWIRQGSVVHDDTGGPGRAEDPFESSVSR